MHIYSLTHDCAGMSAQWVLQYEAMNDRLAREIACRMIANSPLPGPFALWAGPGTGFLADRALVRNYSRDPLDSSREFVPHPLTGPRYRVLDRAE